MSRTRYNEFVFCLRGGDEDACKGLRQWARSICPDDWVERWDEERGNGNFAGVSETPEGGGH